MDGNSDASVAAPTNPFTPNWGVPPRQFVGREELTGSILTALKTGPSADAFTTLLIGPRGSGKTTALRIIENEVRAMGWHVIQADKTEDPLEQRIKMRVRSLYQTAEGLPSSAVEEVTESQFTEVGLSRLFRWGKRKTSTPRTVISEDDDLQTHCRALAEHSAEQGVGVLLTLDEMHDMELDSLSNLFAAIQLITKGDGAPLAFIGAGLPQLREKLLSGEKSTFLQRCHKEDMTPLSPQEVESCLVLTAAESGGVFDSDALDLLVGRSVTLPYRVQLLGSSAWAASDAPNWPIDSEAAQKAVCRANDLWHSDVAVYIWARLNDSCKEYLAALADLGGRARPEVLAQKVTVSVRTQNNARRRLVEMGYMECLPGGELRIAGVLDTEDVRYLTRTLGEHYSADEDGVEDRDRTGMTQKCGALMPRVNLRCVLPSGHAGKHRSK